MRVKFNQAAYFGKREFSKGVHEVSGDILGNKFFHKMIQAGMVEDGEMVSAVSPLSISERKMQFAEKVLGAVPVKEVKAVEALPPVLPEVESAPEPTIENVSEDFSAPETEELPVKKPSKKTKK